MKKRTLLKQLVWVPITVSLLFGCGGKGKDLKIEGNPETLYREGLARFNKKDYIEAQKKFEELKSSFPDSPPFTVLAELKVGDCHFLKKEYVEAIAAYEEFKKTHPSHEEIPYVQFQIGMSHFNQMLTLDRDQSSTKKALSSFEYLIASYPPSLFTEKAREKIGVCKERLAGHEFYIGNFYYKEGRFEAAAPRFEGLLEKFPKTLEEDKILYLLGKSYIELDQWKNAETAFGRIVAGYPKSSYTEEARKMLDKGLGQMEVSHRKNKAADGKDGAAGIDPGKIAWIKFDEEGKQPVSLKEEKKISPAITSDPVQTSFPKEEKKKKSVSPPTLEPIQEGRAQSFPPSREAIKSEPILPPEPVKEGQAQLSPPPLSVDAASRMEVKPDEEKRVAAFPATSTPSGEKVDVRKKAVPETATSKLASPADKSQPIDITSDKVEARWKENLVIFKGNVIARQKDIVIYADSLEVVTIEDGKGIERVTAGGNVKIQQGPRVAHCQKAVFYNADQKMVLTGDPKVSEGDNLVLGDEIIFDIDKNRVEVKGGPSGRGKAKVLPGEIQKLK